MTSSTNVTRNGMAAGYPQLDTISGITKAHLSVSDSYQGPQTASIPANITMDPQVQWAKPLVRTLRALQKLNMAFNMHDGRSNSRSTGTVRYVDSLTAPSSSTYARTPSVTAHAGFTPNMGSLPPLTPESSSSGDWTFPNLLDRAAEYIHPPLWG